MSATGPRIYFIPKEIEIRYLYVLEFYLEFVPFFFRFLLKGVNVRLNQTIWESP